MTVQELTTLLNGVYIRVTADEVATPQCVDVAQVWNRIFNGPRFTGDAVNIIDQAGSTYTRVDNAPDNFPSGGDIVVWGANSYHGPAGHVAVATGNNTDSTKFEVLSQNDPFGSDCEIKSYSYDDVVGWLHPTNSETTAQVIAQTTQSPLDFYNGQIDLSNSTKQDKFAKALGFQNYQDYQDNHLIVIGTNPSTSTNFGQMKVADARNTIFDFENKRDSLANQLSIAINQPKTVSKTASSSPMTVVTTAPATPTTLSVPTVFIPPPPPIATNSSTPSFWDWLKKLLGG